MAGLTGARDTLNILQDQRRIDMADRISLLEPDLQPLAVFSRRIPKKAAVSPQFSWLEDEGAPRFDQANGGETSGSTTIDVDHGSYFAEHYICQVTRTGENFRVTGVTTNALTVVRGVGSTAATINDNDEILIIGVAQPEYDTSRPARSSNPSKVENFTQIFREPFEASGTLLASGFVHNPTDWRHQARKAGIEHGKDIEYAMLHGRKSVDTSGSHPRRTTGGALSFIVTNQTDAGGQLTEVEFNAAMRQQSRYSGRKSKLGLASGLAVSVLNGYPLGRLQFRQDDSTYGINIANFVTPFGNLNLVVHWLLEGQKYGGYLVILDMDEVRYRYLSSEDENRDTSVLTNRQETDRDGRKHEYLTECGLEFGQEKKHGVITGITS